MRQPLKVSRIDYFIRAEPFDRRVSPDLRERLFDALTMQFDAELREEWDSIWITSVPQTGGIIRSISRCTSV